LLQVFHEGKSGGRWAGASELFVLLMEKMRGLEKGRRKRRRAEVEEGGVWK